MHAVAHCRAHLPGCLAAAPLLLGQASLAGDAPADAFMAALAGECGRAYAGRIVANEPASPGDPFVGQTITMHVRECSPDEIRIPLHVGGDRSRTWVVTRTRNGLKLAHDHRHEDGTPDELTLYGGVTVAPGTAERQEFPADAGSRALFERTGRAVSTANVWALEIVPGRLFAYELTRPARKFRIEFDLALPVAAPPAPWGAAAKGDPGLGGLTARRP